MNKVPALLCFLFLGLVLLIGGACNNSSVLVFSGASMTVGLAAMLAVRLR